MLMVVVPASDAMRQLNLTLPAVSLRPSTLRSPCGLSSQTHKVCIASHCPLPLLGLPCELSFLISRSFITQRDDKTKLTLLPTRLRPSHPILYYPTVNRSLATRDLPLPAFPSAPPPSPADGAASGVTCIWRRANTRIRYRQRPIPFGFAARISPHH